MTDKKKPPALNFNFKQSDANSVTQNCSNNLLVIPEANRGIYSLEFERNTPFNNSSKHSERGFFSVGTCGNFPVSFSRIPDVIESFSIHTQINPKKITPTLVPNAKNYSFEHSSNINDKNIKADISEGDVQHRIRPLLKSFFESKETPQNTEKQERSNVNSFPLNSKEKRPNEKIHSENEPGKTNKNAKKIKCTCVKSFCLRLYCACFSNKTICGPDCSCVGCYNDVANEQIRETIMKDTIEKNPLAFTSKYKKLLGDDKMLHARGCNCSKTGCIKKYCECFNAKTGCSRLCRCTNCKNDNIEIEVSDIKVYYEKVLRKRRKKTTLTKLYENKNQPEKK